MNILILILTATPSNVLATKIGTRCVVVIGSLLMTLGFILSSFADCIAFLYISFGCIVGTSLKISLHIMRTKFKLTGNAISTISAISNPPVSGPKKVETKTK